MNPVVHFEMPYEDRDRMVTFYKLVFGWKMQMIGEEMENYVLATKADQDVKSGVPSGSVNGGVPEEKGLAGTISIDCHRC